MEEKMTEQEFYAFLGYIEAAIADDKRTTDFINKIHKLTELLDETDQDDHFGTQYWRYRLGWEK